MADAAKTEGARAGRPKPLARQARLGPIACLPRLSADRSLMSPEALEALSRKRLRSLDHEPLMSVPAESICSEENREHLEHHHPGAVAGEAARTATHTANGVNELGHAIQEGKAAAQALKQVETMGCVAAEIQVLNAVQESAKAALVLEAADQGADLAREAMKLADARIAGVTEMACGFDKAAAQIADAAVPSGKPSVVGLGLPHPKGVGLKILFGLSMLGGGIQIAQGGNQIRQGKFGEGFKNLIAGGGYAGAGVAELTLATRVAARLAAPLAGVASIVEGSYQFVRGYKHDNVTDCFLGATKAIGGTLLGASPFLAGSIVGAPLGVVSAIAGTALIGTALFVEFGPALWGWVKKGANRLFGS